MVRWGGVLGRRQGRVRQGEVMLGGQELGTGTAERVHTQTVADSPCIGRDGGWSAGCAEVGEQTRRDFVHRLECTPKVNLRQIY